MADDDAEVPSRMNAPADPLAQTLGPFLRAHDLSSLSKITHSQTGETTPVIQRPWGDRSMSLLVSEDDTPLITTLNNVYLPSRYSAIWHKDTKDFEVLWTAFKPPPRGVEVVGRSSHLNFEKRNMRALSVDRASERWT
jgi:hypothetical protein